jgi:hypothetical protein
VLNNDNTNGSKVNREKKNRRGETTTMVKSRPDGGLVAGTVAAQRWLSGLAARPDERGEVAPPHESDDSS